MIGLEAVVTIDSSLLIEPMSLAQSTQPEVESVGMAQAPQPENEGVEVMGRASAFLRQ